MLELRRKSFSLKYKVFTKFCTGYRMVQYFQLYVIFFNLMCQFFILVPVIVMNDFYQCCGAGAAFSCHY